MKCDLIYKIIQHELCDKKPKEAMFSLNYDCFNSGETNKQLWIGNVVHDAALATNTKNTLVLKTEWKIGLSNEK